MKGIIVAGTKEGAAKAARKNIERYGKDFYKKIGKKGGQNGNTGGFTNNKELASVCGRLGGTNSRRGRKDTYKKEYKMVSMVIVDNLPYIIDVVINGVLTHLGTPSSLLKYSKGQKVTLRVAKRSLLDLAIDTLASNSIVKITSTDVE